VPLWRGCGGEMYPNELGRAVEDEWLRTPSLRPQVELDVFVVMPNHLHGIVIIRDGEADGGVRHHAPTERAPGSLRTDSQTLGAIVRGFKAAAATRVNAIRCTPHVRVWQRNYYEHVVRDESDLGRIQEYILNNPANWEEDEHNSRFHP
jgi:REP-associated tyrosine transposase